MPGFGDNPTLPSTPTQPGDESGRADSWSIPPQGHYFEKAGDRIGPYRLLQPLGEGGFGIVWLAERREPMVQRVAIKILKPGMDSRSILARFEQERQALAMMDHPNIAKVFDAGMTGHGRPYFVMEYIEGEPVTRYCDRQKVGTRVRLQLFAQICDAIQHAHTKGLIHRDIKPSNLLVMIRDDQLIPKVIDFGVAKAIAHTSSAGEIFTELGVLIGTPEYMSPEQAEMGSAGLDQRSDVYSLGVVLYEMLVGALPFDGERLRSAAYGEIQRIIREEDPPKPSTRLSDLVSRVKQQSPDHDASAQIAADADDLVSELKQELEWIPLKAMRKDRTQRYESARDLARDVRNYLEGRPLEAGPESVAYRMRKFVRRHRWPVAAGTLLATAIVLGLAGTTFGLVRAASALRQAQQAAASEQAVRTVFERTFDDANPAEASALGLTVEESLHNAAKEADQSLAAQPRVLGDVKFVIGRSLRRVGAGQEASQTLAQSLPLLEAAYGAHSRQVAECRAELARAYYLVGEDAKAFEASTAALAWFESDAADPAAAAAMLNHMAVIRHGTGQLEQAHDLATRAVRTVPAAGHAAEAANYRETLAAIQFARGDLKAAAAAYEEIFALPLAPRDLASYQRNYAWQLKVQGRLEEARTLLTQAVERLEQSDKPLDPVRIDALKTLGIVEQELASFAQASTRLTEATRLAEQAVNAGFARVDLYVQCAMSLANCAADAAYLNLDDQALTTARAMLDATLEAQGQVANPICDVLEARILLLEGKNDQAYIAAARASQRLEGTDVAAIDPSFKAQCDSVLGEACLKTGKTERARELLPKAAAEISSIRGESHLRTRQARERVELLERMRPAG